MTGEKVFSAVDSIREQIIAINDYIHANPEVGYAEVKSAKYLVEQLQAAGFAVEAGAGGFPTAFKAVYQGKGPGPTVAFLAEYDALPVIGHACGHNLIAAAACGAGMALQKLMGDLPGTIVVMGTPAEEVPPPVKGKMIENGAFDGVDVSLTIHGADRTAAGGLALAVDTLDITYEGKTSHAAASPDRGRSALDGALLAMHAIEMLREHVRSDTRIHGIITNGGEAANIVPGKATLRYMVRALDRSYVDAVVQRLEKCFQAGALATETSVTITNMGKWDNKINVGSLNSAILEYARLAGAERVMEPSEDRASTDFGNVTHRMPSAGLSVAFVPPGTPGHNPVWTAAGATPAGHQACLVGAKAMAAVAYDLLTQPDYLQAVQEEFKRLKGQTIQR